MAHSYRWTIVAIGALVTCIAVGAMFSLAVFLSPIARARDSFAQSIMGTVLGSATMLSSLGMALGPVGGGCIFDVFCGYAWMYLVSAGLGLAAAAIAVAFPDPKRPDGSREQAIA